jgi:hypothetical protein
MRPKLGLTNLPLSSVDLLGILGPSSFWRLQYCLIHSRFTNLISNSVDNSRNQSGRYYNKTSQVNAFSVPLSAGTVHRAFAVRNQYAIMDNDFGLYV